MPEMVGGHYGVSFADCAVIMATASGANDGSSIEPRCSQAMVVSLHAPPSGSSAAAAWTGVV